jgi:carbon-monoxide dehydrogenase medium subunit
MKPPAFVYHRPRSVAEALAMLRAGGADAKVLAGGQSLVPMLNMRLAAPHALVDINGLAAELGGISVAADEVRIGALVRHSAMERHDGAYAALPLLRQATRHVAHPTIRNRGTTVGSIVHADPAAELPAVLLLCDGSVQLAGGGDIAAAEFFVGPLETVLPVGELAVSVSFRRPPPGSGTAWVEVSRRAGDYALCGLGMRVTLDGDRRVVAAKAAYVSVAPTPVLIDLTATAGDWAAAGRLAASTVDPEPDIHASADYRRHLVDVLTQRAGAAAVAQAVSMPDGEG